MNFADFFGELKRRNVYKVLVAYIVAGWALAQGLAQVLPVFDTPNWVIRLIVVLIIMGLPFAGFLAWAFEMTPEGIKRTAAADAMIKAPIRKNGHGSTSLSPLPCFRWDCFAWVDILLAAEGPPAGLTASRSPFCPSII